MLWSETPRLATIRPPQKQQALKNIVFRGPDPLDPSAEERRREPQHDQSNRVDPADLGIVQSRPSIERVIPMTRVSGTLKTLNP